MILDIVELVKLILRIILSSDIKSGSTDCYTICIYLS